MKSSDSTPKVLFVGDSRQMKGGVNAVIQSIERTPLWEKYRCTWLECQINDRITKKIAYLLRALFKAVFTIPRYDLIHFHTAIGNSMMVQLPFFLYARILRKKTVLHLHVGDQLKKECNSRLLRFYSKRADCIITLGDSLRQYVPAPSEKVEFLYNPAPEIRHKDAPRKFFLFAAYIDSERNKGYDVLLEAFAVVARHHPEWKLLICGEGDMDQLHHLIRKNHVENSVSTPGWVMGNDKDRIFSEAFAYCLASRKEGLPVTILESLSIGLPIIATPVGSLPEFLTEGESVLFAKIGDASDLARQMCRLIENPDLYEKLSKGGTELIRSLLSLDKFTEKLDSIYSSLCD